MPFEDLFGSHQDEAVLAIEGRARLRHLYTAGIGVVGALDMEQCSSISVSLINVITLLRTRSLSTLVDNHEALKDSTEVRRLLSLSDTDL